MSAADTQQLIHTLYIDHHGWLKGWLRRRLDCSEDAADFAQDAFVSVLRTGIAPDIREPRSFLATIAGRLILQRHRRQKLEQAYLEALAALPEACAPSPERHLLALEALQELDCALAGLPEPVRSAFLLAHLQDMSYAQIAERLGVSLSSVKQYLTRANRQCFFALADLAAMGE